MDASAGPFGALIEGDGERLGLLSARERAILDLAVEGRTDTQIAQILELSQATVNSYWVRIRGKLGQFSRTEIVARFLRHQTRLEHAALRAENLRLQDELGRATEAHHELLAVHAGSHERAWYLTALVHSPVAMLVTKPPASILFVNRLARKLYRAGAGEMEGLPMRDLTVSATPEEFREPCRELFREEGPARETVGVERPYYARRRDGTNFRAVLQAERFDGPESPLAVVVVREFLGESEVIIQALRQPLAAVS